MFLFILHDSCNSMPLWNFPLALVTQRISNLPEKYHKSVSISPKLKGKYPNPDESGILPCCKLTVALSVSWPTVMTSGPLCETKDIVTYILVKQSETNVCMGTICPQVLWRAKRSSPTDTVHWLHLRNLKLKKPKSFIITQKQICPNFDSQGDNLYCSEYKQICHLSLSLHKYQKRECLCLPTSYLRYSWE